MDCSAVERPRFGRVSRLIGASVCHLMMMFGSRSGTVTARVTFPLPVLCSARSHVIRSVAPTVAAIAAEELRSAITCGYDWTTRVPKAHSLCARNNLNTPLHTSVFPVSLFLLVFSTCLLSTLLFHPLSSISSLNIWSRRVSVSPRYVSVCFTARVKHNEKTHPCVLPSVFSLLSLSFVISPSFHVLLVNQNTPNTKCILNSLHTRLPSAKYIHTYVQETAVNIPIGNNVSVTAQCEPRAHSFS